MSTGPGGMNQILPWLNNPQMLSALIQNPHVLGALMGGSPPTAQTQPMMPSPRILPGGFFTGPPTASPVPQPVSVVGAAGPPLAHTQPMMPSPNLLQFAPQPMQGGKAGSPRPTSKSFDDETYNPITGQYRLIRG